MALIEHLAAVDPRLGLRAGVVVDSGEGGLLEAAARSRPTLGDALDSLRRHLRLLSDDTELVLVRGSSTMTCEFRALFGVHGGRIVNDFVVASFLSFLWRAVATSLRPAEIRLVHERPECIAAYSDFFGGVRISFGAPHNAVVLPSESTAAPMVHANAAAAGAFNLKATETVERLRSATTTSRRVQEEIARLLPDGRANVRKTAERLAMSEATLRRRLLVEGTSFARILDDTRRELALYYLLDPTTR